MLNRNSQNDSMVRAAVSLPTANRSAAAFESEALPHLNDLYRTALHMLQQSAKASDAVQETYFRAWKAFGKYQRGTNYKAWLFQILINVVRHKRGSRFNRTTLPNGSDTPDHVVSAMSRVPVEFMEVLLLIDGQGFPYSEAAEILGLSTDVVAHRVVLGRNHLHSQVEACCSTPVPVA